MSAHRINGSTFQVIRNPNKLFNKFEVWYAGEMDVQNERGFLVSEKVAKPVKSCMTEAQANDFITYQVQVKQFKESA